MDKKKLWKIANRDKERLYHRKSYRKNKDYYKKYALIHKDRLYRMLREYQLRNIDSWRIYFSNKNKCQICGRKVVFSSGISRNSIHFDHRNGGGEAIRGIPMSWFRSHPRTSNNEKILESCDFGILCFRCNKFLPTKDRGKWLDSAMKYYKSSKHNVL